MNIRKHIPNTITCLSLVSGCIATVMALQDNYLWAAIWIIIAAVFDFLDVSFGVAPGMIVFSMLGQASLPLGEIGRYIPYLAFVIPAFSGLRLAKFNIDERQTTSFIGMPVPAHALFWASVGYSLSPLSQANNVLFIVVTLVVALATSLLLVSEIPMFSLKIKSVAWKGNERRYILVGCAVLFVAFFGMLGIAGTILLYILLSIFNKRQ